MSINAKQLREAIIRPTLTLIGLYSEAAENLLFGTAAHESNGGTYVKQVGGPALGLYQMEPRTYDDIWNSYLTGRTLREQVLSACMYEMKPPAEHLLWNMRLSTIMCRLHYLRVPKALPASDDIDGLAAYWKQYYNTPLGKGTPEQFKADFVRLNNAR